MTRYEYEHDGDMLYQRAVRAEAAYERAQQQANDALNEAARLKEELSEAKKQITDLETERDKALVTLAHTDIGSLPNDWTLQDVAEARIDDLLKLRDQPARGEQERFERVTKQVVYSIADFCSLEIPDAAARSIAREILRAADQPAQGERDAGCRVEPGDGEVLLKIDGLPTISLCADDVDGFGHDLGEASVGLANQSGVTVRVFDQPAQGERVSLRQQVDQAQAEVATWPEWMTRSYRQGDDQPAQGERDDRLPEWVCRHPGFQRAVRAAGASAYERGQDDMRERAAQAMCDFCASGDTPEDVGYPFGLCHIGKHKGWPQYTACKARAIRNLREGGDTYES